ncbi:hypothetical protein D3C81_1256120 [compost metagenome]
MLDIQLSLLGIAGSGDRCRVGRLGRCQHERVGGLRNGLLAPAVIGMAEAQAQRRVMADHVRQRGTQRRRVDGRLRLQQHRLVEAVARGRGQRLAEESPLHRRQRRRAVLRRVIGGVLRRHVHALCHLCQRGHGLVLEHLSRRQAPALQAGARDDLQAEDRVAAEREEVVVQTHLRDA